MADKIVFSIEECALALGVSYNHIRKLIREGTIPCVRLGERRIVIPVDAVKEYLKKSAESGGAYVR